MLVSPFAFAETFVVFDSGKARDIEVYYGKGEQYVPRKPFSDADVKKALDAQFPLVSHLPMESFSAYKIETKLPYNIAVVGTDETSQMWLQSHFKKIKESSAVLLDKSVDTATLEKISIAMNEKNTVVNDIHVWKIASSHQSAILSVSSNEPLSSKEYKAMVKEALPHVSHISIEVNN